MADQQQSGAGRKCSECKQRILAGEVTVPDGKGGVICEDCQAGT